MRAQSFDWQQTFPHSLEVESQDIQFTSLEKLTEEKAKSYNKSRDQGLKKMAKSKKIYSSSTPKNSTHGISIRESILDSAYHYLGKPYKWAGNGPDGFDCSGFTRYIYKKNNYSIPRISRDQHHSAQPVEIDDLLPGDLIFFSNGHHINHVGIVITNDGQDIKMIHSSTSQGVSISGTKSSSYWRTRIHSGGSFLPAEQLILENPAPILKEIAEEPTEKPVPVEPDFEPDKEERIVKQKEPKIKRERQPTMVNYGVGIKANALGFGGEFITDFNSKFQVRAGGTMMNIKSFINSETLQLYGDNQIQARSLSLVANWQIARRIFIAGGALYSQFQYDIVGPPDQGLTFGVLSIEPGKVEKLRATIASNWTLSPYLGLGWGGVLTHDKKISASLEIGGILNSINKVTLDSFGSLSPVENSIQAQLLNDKMRGPRFLPMIGLQISIAFD